MTTYDREAIIRALDDARTEREATAALLLARKYLATRRGRDDDEVRFSVEGADRIRTSWMVDPGE